MTDLNLTYSQNFELQKNHPKKNLTSKNTSKKAYSYYPFGMTHKGYNNVVSSNANSVGEAFKYNGKELEEDLGLGQYDYGARFYNPEIGRWTTIDPLAEKYMSVSPYNYALNNPVFFIDPDGREIDISELMKSKEHAQAFILFAQTEEGTAFLKNYASEGQTLEYDGEVFFEAEEAGKYDEAGIDLVYKVGDEKEKSVTGYEHSSDHGLDINVEVAKEGFGSDNKTFNLAKAIVHESFLHADSKANDFMDNRRMDKSNLPSDYKKYGIHADHYYASMESLYNAGGTMSQALNVQGLSVLRQVSKKLNLNYSNTKLKTIMWKFDGSLIKVKPKTGVLIYNNPYKTK